MLKYLSPLGWEHINLAGAYQEATLGGRWKIMTILGAMSLNGIVATMTVEEP